MNQKVVLLLRTEKSSEHLCAAFANKGLGVIHAPTMGIESLASHAQTPTNLRAALACSVVVFTSPNAVRHAASIQSLANSSAACWAVGSVTRQMLLDQGCASVHMGDEPNSESMLAGLWASQKRAPKAVGLVTAPNGRGVIEAEIEARGITLQRADVYLRVPKQVPQTQWDAIHHVAKTSTLATLLTSEQAWAALVAQTSAAWRVLITQQHAVVSSARLVHVAVEAGFDPQRIHNTQSMKPQKLADAVFQAMRMR